MIGLTPEQQARAKRVHDYVSRFPAAEESGGLPPQSCYDCMWDFIQVVDSSSKVQVDYICQQYPGFLRFAAWMKLFAQGIADGIIDAPTDKHHLS